MIDFLFFITFKIPLIFIIAIIVLYLVYLRNTHEIVNAECINSIKNKEKIGYTTTYRYFSINGNLIEQIEKPLNSFFKKKCNQNYKLFIATRNQNVAKQFRKTITICAFIIFLSLILIVFG